MYPDDLRYTKEHEWARVEGARVRVGITQFAAERLSDVVFIELPPQGTALSQGAVFGVIESVKAVSDLYAPISGTVVETNAALVEQPELVNEDPYGKGWMILIDPADAAELERLLTAGDYRRLIGEVAT